MFLLTFSDIGSQFFAGFLEFLVLFESLNLDSHVVFELTREHLVGCLRKLQKRVIGYFHLDCLNLSLCCFCGLVKHPIAWLLIPLEESLIFQQFKLHSVSPSGLIEF